jgi:hypothetical protein
MMDTLTVELTAALVDNQATPSARTKVEITLSNSSGRISVENCEGSPRSLHRFIVRDAQDVGVGAVHNLTAEQAGFILATSCSITNPRILFSTLQPDQLSVSLKKSAEVPSKAQVVDTPTGKQVTMTATVHVISNISTLLGTKLTLDEVAVFNVINRLLAFKIFDTTNRSILEQNVSESIKSYRQALMAADRLSCYQSLFNALEKAINADQELKGEAFDRKTSTLTSLTQTEVKDIREFNNRVKHVLRKKSDFAALKTGEAQLAQLARNLKKAADNAILSRI